MKLGDLIGIPFKPRGRDLRGMDCLGLVIYIYKNFLNIDIPDYREYSNCWYENGENTLVNKLDEFSDLWYSVSVPKKYDILTYRHGVSSVTNHCAIYIGDNKIIHCYENTPVVIDRIDRDYWKSRLVDIMRYKCL